MNWENLNRKYILEKCTTKANYQMCQQLQNPVLSSYQKREFEGKLYLRFTFTCLFHFPVSEP